MKINAHAVPEAGLDLSDAISARGAGLDSPELDVVGDCHLSVRLRKLGARYHVTGAIRVTVALTCARCLARMEKVLEPSLQMVFESAHASATRTETQIRNRDLGLSFFEGNEIDLGPELRQAVLLAIPHKPICRADCRGLCPSCGANLNVESCRCQRPTSHASGGTLRDLLTKWGSGTRAR